MLKQFWTDFLAAPGWGKIIIIVVPLGFGFYSINHSHGITNLVDVPCDDAKQPPRVEVEIRDQQFVPKAIEATACASLTITNRDATLHEPAAGPHPNHDAYPELSAPQPLGQDESYTIQLNKRGTVAIHDHLNEAIRGSVTIN